MEDFAAMRPLLTLTALSLYLTAATASAQVDARLLRYPDVSETHIAFVYAGDIWLVEKGGGTAHRLSSPPGEELFPRFSPDGSELAFSANYDGNTDVYVIPVDGRHTAAPELPPRPGPDLRLDPEWRQRCSFHPGGRAACAASASSISSRPTVGSRRPCRFPTAISAPSPRAGSTIAYTTRDRGFRTWKRYRGGTAPDIWLFDLETLDARNLTDSAANDSQPMWHGDTLYFLSDQGPELRSNIWALDTTKSEMRQVTRFTDVDVTFPAIGPSDIVFQAGGRLYLMGLDDEGYDEVEVDIVTDLASLRPRWVNASDLIQWADISPSGKTSGLPGPGRDLHRPRQARCHPEPEPQLGCGRAIPSLVARRQADRRLERCFGRVRADSDSRCRW